MGRGDVLRRLEEYKSLGMHSAYGIAGGYGAPDDGGGCAGGQ